MIHKLDMLHYIKTSQIEYNYKISGGCLNLGYGQSSVGLEFEEGLVQSLGLGSGLG